MLLIHQQQKRQPLNFETIYEQHKSLVYNLALQSVQNIEDAEEITQDVFVIVYEKLGEFRQEAKPSTWIYRITINRSLDFIKAKKRKKRFAFISSLFKKDNATLEHEPSDFKHPGVLLEQKEEMKALFAALN
jgi:RNA polymerase sigma-70 factor (ECF subfamily)